MKTIQRKSRRFTMSVENLECRKLLTGGGPHQLQHVAVHNVPVSSGGAVDLNLIVHGSDVAAGIEVHYRTDGPRR